ncbi:MAG: hypothetical protein MJY43_01635 [Bacteroidales bacterium]|nr:hypothetical protein [Bacteroidales bacterium]
MKKLIIAAIFSMISIAGANAQPKIIAHAGYWNCERGGKTMNSEASLRAALEAGLYGVEFDVNMTKDGKLVVFHDGGIKGKCINDMTFEEVHSAVVLKNGESIPTVEQFLEIAAGYPDTRLFLEIKFSKTLGLEKKCVDILLGLLKEYGLDNPQRVVPISFSANICKYLGEIAPEYETQYITYNSSASNVRKLGVSGVDYEFGYIKRNPIYTKNNPDITVNVWTVDNDEDIIAVANAGVKYITSNNPLRAMELVKGL